jgi:hypothetical protein
MVFGKKEIVDEPAASKVVVRNQSEGSGIYSCTQGECATNPFTTQNKEEFDKHGKGLKLHYQQGVAPCVICKEEVDFSKVLTVSGNAAIHPECAPKVEAEL